MFRWHVLMKPTSVILAGLLCAGCASGQKQVASSDVGTAREVETVACSTGADQARSAAIGAAIGAAFGGGFGKLSGRNGWLGAAIGAIPGAAAGYMISRNEACPEGPERIEAGGPVPLIKPIKQQAMGQP